MTNKWEVRHNLEKGGWWVAYGKEIGYQEYYDFSQAIAASVATDNPGPAIAYLDELVTESVTTLLNNAGEKYADELAKVGKRELAGVMLDAFRVAKGSGVVSDSNNDSRPLYSPHQRPGPDHGKQAHLFFREYMSHPFTSQM